MQILTSEDNEGTSFARSFLRASGYAVTDSVLSAARSGDRIGLESAGRLLSALRSDAGWLKWPLTALASEVPAVQRLRPHSTIESPLPNWEHLLDPANGFVSDRTRHVLDRAGPIGKLAREFFAARGRSGTNHERNSSFTGDATASEFPPAGGSLPPPGPTAALGDLS